MYASDMLFIENDFGRYNIGSTTDGLKNDSDHSLTILIQEDKAARHLKLDTRSSGKLQSDDAALRTGDICS